MMSDANRGWLFYKYPFLYPEQYKSKIKEANKYILETKKSSYTYPNGAYKSIELKTIYPGLVIGSGYIHSLKGVEDNFNFGFFFDYTTGMPVIPGSTIKGILRSLFGQNKKEKYKTEKESLIKDLLNKQDIDIDVTALFKEIFLGIDAQTGKEKSIYYRDIFYDAYILSGDREGYIFKDDSITPHSKDGLGEPVPNRMLKVAPDVNWRFSFDLHDGIISSEEKEALFLQLLQWHGVGAKTNVGYGQFEGISNEEKALIAYKEYTDITSLINDYENSELKDKVSAYNSEFKLLVINFLNKVMKNSNENIQEKINFAINRVNKW